MAASIFNLAEYTLLAMLENIQQAMRAYKGKNEYEMKKAMAEWTSNAVLHRSAPPMSMSFQRDPPKFEADADPYKNSPWRGLDANRKPADWR